MPLPAAHLVHDSNGHGHLSSGPTLSETESIYRAQGVGKDKTFIRGASGYVDVGIEHLDDKLIDAYTSADAAALRDAMLKKGYLSHQLNAISLLSGQYQSDHQ